MESVEVLNQVANIIRKLQVEIDVLDLTDKPEDCDYRCGLGALLDEFKVKYREIELNINDDSLEFIDDGNFVGFVKRKL